MTLPDFLVIGAMRSGTTWLDGVLRSHPDIYLPERRKEVNFFHKFYDRGIDWYQKFFPSPGQVSQYSRIGEVTPAYLYSPEAPIRIKECIPHCQLIIILRNPADRAYSHYGFKVKNLAEPRSFQEVLCQDSALFTRGLYGQHIKNYLQYFSLDNFLILLYEDVRKNPDHALSKITNFLSVKPNLFDQGMIERKANTSGRPHLAKARVLAGKFRDFLRKKDLDWVWNVAKSSGMEQIFFTKSQALPPIEPDVRAELLTKYESDIAALEEVIGIDLDIWRKLC
ncbi:MAG: sulfotransferase domain-containing protein [Symploca sp. SIO1C2]|nr:sulfotransferase domain-containing protein [Symploca sp. SIO1C2]